MMVEDSSLIREMLDLSKDKMEDIEIAKESVYRERLLVSISSGGSRIISMGVFCVSAR